MFANRIFRDELACTNLSQIGFYKNSSMYKCSQIRAMFCTNVSQIEKEVALAASFLIFLIVNNDKLELEFFYKPCCLLNKIHSSFFVVNQLCADSSRLAISFATVSYVSGLHFLILMPNVFWVSSDTATIPLPKTKYTSPK